MMVEEVHHLARAGADPTLVGFLTTALAAMAAFTAWLVKKFLQLFRESITTMAEVKAAVMMVKEAVDNNSRLVEKHIAEEA